MIRLSAPASAQHNNTPENAAKRGKRWLKEIFHGTMFSVVLNAEKANELINFMFFVLAIETEILDLQRCFVFVCAFSRLSCRFFRILYFESRFSETSLRFLRFSFSSYTSATQYFSACLR